MNTKHVEQVPMSALTIGKNTKRLKNMKINDIVNEDLTYKGYRCTIDCSGHKAGYAWAAARNIQSTSECPIGASNSFTEGCYSYAQGR